MLPIIGIVIVFVMVFGGYSMAGGKMDVILHSLPYEMTMIGGATVGAFLIANKGDVAKAALKDLSKCFKGAKWSKQDYADLLCLMFMVTKTIKTKGLLAVEEHIERPHESTIFTQFPKIAHDHFALDFICDTLR
ncbi:MAG: motility-associated protein, partial [Alphaproteobacteria bacterium]